MPNGVRDPLAGINSFAPEFWKLLAADAPTIPAMPKPEGPPVPAAPPQDTRPPLTSDALEALRDSIGARADNLQDVPAPVVPPYPPFTGNAPPLTNQRLQALRDAVPEVGELHDIPSPPWRSPRRPPDPPVAGVEDTVANKVKQIESLRSRIGRLESEKGKRTGAKDGAAFDQEIAKAQREIAQAEAELSKATLHMPRFYPDV
jgi:hypothetical protein